ncbi:MAG: YggS family pyridoxal phosphate-dependent enzyme [Myxococcales bacterium]
MGIADNLRGVRERIDRACERAKRDPASVTLVAVSKVQPIEAIREALEAGQRDFGENYAQELRDKADAIGGPEERASPATGGGRRPQHTIAWHFLGALQTNKVKMIVGRVALLHTCDRPSLAQELNKRAASLGIVQRVLVEVNLAREPQKGGIAPADLPAFVATLRNLPSLRCEGLMCIPPAEEESRLHFRRLRELRDELGVLPELSMGMSADYETAIEEGATIVRVGTAIFGERPPKT